MSKPGILFNELIDQYKLEQHLAQKRVTDHYLALDVDENEPVAIEILLPGLSAQAAYSKRFVAKIQAVSQLNHPHIARIYQVGVAPNQRPYFARQYVEGVPLSEHVAQLANQEHPVHTVYALKLVRQIADALSLAERLDLYHYDLHPENIMFKANGDISLIDLGIPRIKKSDGDAFLGGVAFDTRYWSPEQVQNKPLDAKSHVYSLGIILFELLTGHVVSANLTGGSRFGSLFSGSTLEKLRPDLAYETVRLVQRALRLTLNGRFNNSQAFLAAIDEAIQAEELLLHSETAVRRPRALSRLLLPVGLPLLLLLIATAAILFVRNNAADVPIAVVPEQTVTPTGTATPPPATATIPPTAVSVVEDAGVLLVAPAPDETVTANDAIQFRWDWAEPLGENQEFVIYSFYEGEQTLLARVDVPSASNAYEVTVPISRFAEGSGEYSWQVALLSSITRNSVAESDLRPFTLTLLPTSTPTPTLTPTITPSPTPSPTPTAQPQVVVIVSSVSLRNGPSPSYEILRFLEDGDVVTVIGQNPEFTWWNVVTEDDVVGWLSKVAVEETGDGDLTAVPTAATLPPVPTTTSTPIPTFTPTFEPTAPSGGGGDSDGGDGGGGGGNPNPPPPSDPPTKTPPPP